MEVRQRKIAYRGIQVGLIVLTIVLVAGWVVRKRSTDHGGLSVQFDPPTQVAGVLAGGDVQIFNSDSSVDVLLQGAKLYAGLSPKTVERIRNELKTSTEKDSGLGGQIAQIVKEKVASSIDARAVYDVRRIEQILYRDGALVIEWESGKQEELLGGIDVKGDRSSRRASRTFSAEDVERLAEAVEARKRELERQ